MDLEASILGYIFACHVTCTGSSKILVPVSVRRPGTPAAVFLCCRLCDKSYRRCIRHPFGLQDGREAVLAREVVRIVPLGPPGEQIDPGSWRLHGKTPPKSIENDSRVAVEVRSKEYGAQAEQLARDVDRRHVAAPVHRGVQQRLPQELENSRKHLKTHGKP